MPTIQAISTRLEPTSDSYIKYRLLSPDIWWDLATLLRHRPPLEVIVSRMNYSGDTLQYTSSQEQHLRKLEHRLGIWLHRQGTMRIADSTWTLPTRTQGDPNDLSLALHVLFAQDC
jgi:hypothetical protein